MIKKGMLLLLTAVLGVSLVSCGGGAVKNSSSGALAASSASTDSQQEVSSQPQAASSAVVSSSASSAASSAVASSSSSAVSSAGTDSQQPTIIGEAIGKTQTSINVEVTVTAMGKLSEKKPVESGKSYYYVDITIKNIGTIEHEMSLMQRFHLLDSNREKVTVESFVSKDGKNMNGAKLAAGTSVTGRALFAVPDNFKVAAFTYTFDVMGFGIFTYLAK